LHYCLRTLFHCHKTTTFPSRLTRHSRCRPSQTYECTLRRW
jgi:hypothetical protein